MGRNEQVAPNTPGWLMFQLVFSLLFSCFRLNKIEKKIMFIYIETGGNYIALFDSVYSVIGLPVPGKTGTLGTELFNCNINNIYLILSHN